mgnify:CR=1 FL=1
MLYATLFACICVIVYLVIYLRKVKASEKQLTERFTKVDTKLNSLQLQTLEGKLNPHLFKNILNSIQSHAYQTYYAMDKLSNVLDYILYESQNRFVSPEEEIDFALNLIEINKIKLSPLFSLTIKKKINEKDIFYSEKNIAPLISIDLIENAFKHADLQSPDAFISIYIEFRDSAFSLIVSNKISDKSVFVKEHSGIGSTTLEQRLKIIYGSSFRLERYTEGDVYTAQLKIDLRDYKNKMHSA